MTAVVILVSISSTSALIAGFALARITASREEAMVSGRENGHRHEAQLRELRQQLRELRQQLDAAEQSLERSQQSLVDAASRQSQLAQEVEHEKRQTQELRLEIEGHARKVQSAADREELQRKIEDLEIQAFVERQRRALGGNTSLIPTEVFRERQAVPLANFKAEIEKRRKIRQLRLGNEQVETVTEESSRQFDVRHE